jgi:hypothetical protein
MAITQRWGCINGKEEEKEKEKEGTATGRRKIRMNWYLCNRWQWWAIFPHSTNLSLVGHPLRSSTKMVNVAPQIHCFGESGFGGVRAFG